MKEREESIGHFQWNKINRRRIEEKKSHSLSSSLPFLFFLRFCAWIHSFSPSLSFIPMDMGREMERKREKQLFENILYISWKEMEYFFARVD